MKSEFLNMMDHIASDLVFGALWHEAAASESRRIALRGIARWNNCEALDDFKSFQCLNKLLIDRCNYTPKIEIQIPSVQWSSYKDLPQILQKWEVWETGFAGTITQAFALARDIDVEIYKFLMCLAGEVQNEASKVRIVDKRLAMVGYDAHDVARCNQIMHHFFEHEAKGDGDIDFNI